PNEEKTRSPARRLAPRRLSAALHHGGFHPDAVRHGSQTCPFPKWHRLRQSLRRWHPGLLTLDRAVPGYRWLKSVTGLSYAYPPGPRIGLSPSTAWAYSSQL